MNRAHTPEAVAGGFLRQVRLDADVDTGRYPSTLPVVANLIRTGGLELDPRMTLSWLDLLGPPLPHPRVRQTRQTITKFLPLIHNTLDHGLSNALSEATNTHIRLLTRRAYGHRSPDALIAMTILTRGGLSPPPAHPGRS